MRAIRQIPLYALALGILCVGYRVPALSITALLWLAIMFALALGIFVQAGGPGSPARGKRARSASDRRLAGDEACAPAESGP